MLPRRRARLLTDEQRSAVAAYFSVYKGQEEGLAKLALSTFDTPCVQRAFELLKTTWIDVRAHIMNPHSCPLRVIRPPWLDLRVRSPEAVSSAPQIVTGKVVKCQEGGDMSYEAIQAGQRVH